jgi:hypothetical protein
LIPQTGTRIVAARTHTTVRGAKQRSRRALETFVMNCVLGSCSTRSTCHGFWIPVRGIFSATQRRRAKTTTKAGTGGAARSRTCRTRITPCNQIARCPRGRASTRSRQLDSWCSRCAAN